MKRVLIVAYYFPPQPKAGALRPMYLARHIGEFGWNPTVLTRTFPGDPGLDCEIVATREWGAPAAAYADAVPAAAGRQRRRHPAEQFLRDAVKSVVHFPDNRVGWLPGATTKARALMRERSFDAVISTAPPPSAHFVARAAVAGTRVPWIADYRDLWAGPPGPYFRHGSGKTRLAFEYGLERRLLRRASAITTPTESHGAAQRAHFSRDDVVVIPNAADMSAWDAIDVAPPTTFTLCYTGKLYPNLRTPDVLFSASAKLRQQGDAAGLAARFEFYGEDPELVLRCAEKYGIRDAVTVHGEVPRAEALRAQRAAAVLVLLLNTAGELDQIENANPGSKILEYAGARRPILALGAPNNLVGEIMDASGLGMFASDEAGCMAALRVLHAQFVSGKLEPERKPGWKPFTPRDLAAAFAALLDRVVAEGRPVGPREKLQHV